MIYINARFLTQKMTGVQRFATELSRQLLKICGAELKFVAPKNIIQHELAKEFNVEIIGSHTGYLWEQIELPRYLKKRNSPILLSFCSVAPLFYDNNIVAVHDITWLRYPETFSKSFRIVYGFLTPRLCNRAKNILTVSKFSLDEISNRFNIDKSKFTIVYNAVDEMFQPHICEELAKEKYFLAVSSVKKNKNFPVVIESFQLLQKKMPEAKLYIIGDLKEKVFAGVSLDIDSIPNVKLLGRVSDEELIRYYSNAQAFIFPSLYEGFGIPVLEAQACGCPVVSTNSSSLPEVLNDSALLCEPTDAQGFADKMVKIATSPDLRDDLIKRGYENVKRFSWEESAKRIAKLL